MRRVVAHIGKPIEKASVSFARVVVVRNIIFLSKKGKWRCSSCRFETTLRSGTVMENSKLPFRYWFITMHLLTATKKGFSTLELQRQLGHKRYQPIWEMVHKLRSVMGQRDRLYQLESVVELDEGFFKSQPEEDSEGR